MDLIQIELPDNLVDRDKRIGAIVTAARHANGRVVIATAGDPVAFDRLLPEADG